MTDLEKHIRTVFAAELQFRFASAVQIATQLKAQQIDLPIEWSYGKHRVKYDEIAIRGEQAEFAAAMLQRSATYLMAVAMKDAIRAAVSDPKSSSDLDIRGAYQISRLIRNAFAHAPFNPTWSIDPDCRDTVFSVVDIIRLDTTGLDGVAFDWHQYGGPLALFLLCRFVRERILHDDVKRTQPIPEPNANIYQIGDLVLKSVESLPPDAKPVKIKRLPDGGISLGDGYVLYDSKDQEDSE